MELDCSVPEDATVQDTLFTLQEKVAKVLRDTVYGRMEQSSSGEPLLPSERCNADFTVNLEYASNVCGCRVAQCEAGRLVTDSFAYVASADVGIYTGGAIGGTLAAGEVTPMDVIGILPHEDEIVKAFLTGVRCAFFDRNLHSRMPFGPHASSLEAIRRVTNGIPLGCPLSHRFTL
jgi:2',3'-cyclic-nucleotide 2'-phosphodiesterase (5'-nucleotidase family)